MTTIVENQDKLVLRWHPGCGHKGGKKYYVGPIGRAGYCVGEEPPKEIEYPVPSSLSFSVYFKDTTTPELFYQIGEELTKLSNLEGIEGEIEVITRPIGEILIKKVKDEYLEEDNRKKAEQLEKDEKINKLVSQLEELKYNIEDFDYESYQTPEEWMEVVGKTLDVTLSSYEVRCHKGTKFYKILEEAGVLESSYPQWYADGKF